MSRASRLVTGGTLVAAGVAMLVLPGPGLLTVAAGLALLERDVPAAGRLAAWGRGLLWSWASPVRE